MVGCLCIHCHLRLTQELAPLAQPQRGFLGPQLLDNLRREGVATPILMLTSKPFEEDRQRAMNEHMRIGHEFETIHNHTTYSFGIDDQEFMTVFECDEPADFMHLMLTLRESEASRYTERDTPIFVGQQMTIAEALDRLDGITARVEA